MNVLIFLASITALWGSCELARIILEKRGVFPREVVT